jgi:hypothetical protein
MSASFVALYTDLVFRHQQNEDFDGFDFVSNQKNETINKDHSDTEEL